jgi:hypothetical protein
MKPPSLKHFAALALSSLLAQGAASGAVYTQNFTFPDGTNSFGDGSVLTAGLDPANVAASVQGGQLQLTGVNSFSTQNSFNIPALANSALGFTATFNVTLIDTLGGNPPADGFSFNYGGFSSASNYGEEGVGITPSISWIVDTWDNGIGGDQGIRSKINGANDYTQFFAPLADGGTLSQLVSLSWNPTNGMSLSLNGNPVFTNRPTPAFTANNSFLFGFGARTGGASETVLIDNLNITTVPEVSGTLLAALGGAGLMLIRRRK